MRIRVRDIETPPLTSNEKSQGARKRREYKRNRGERVFTRGKRGGAKVHTY